MKRSEPLPLLSRVLRGGIESVLFALVALSPWAFGSVHPLSLLILYAGLGVCLLLWAAVLATEGAPASACPVALCVAGMVLLGLWQLLPMSPSLLASVSPSSERAWSSLLPTHPEEIAGETASALGHTISLYPYATRDQALKLLAGLATFLLARHAIASTASLKRFAIVAVANGSLLSVFALVQMLTSPKTQLYWSFDSTGAVFGPFICRNHFPFQVNIFLGLGLGLLLARLPAKAKSKSQRRDDDDYMDKFLKVARDPAAPWLITAIGIMLAANLYSQSRGGVLALGAATALCLAFRFLMARGTGQTWPALVLVGGVALGVVAWFGINRFEKRLQTLWSGDALGDGRARLWQRTLPIAAEYPVWGAGYGTFDFLETTRRSPIDATRFRFEYAHNDYLQTLLEGGFVHLALALVAIGLIYRYSLAAYQLTSKSSRCAVVLGGILGLTTVVIHSFGDFGLHIPSIVLTTATLAGLLVGIGSPQRSEGPTTRTSRNLGFVAAVSCVTVAILLPLDGWRAERAEQLRLASLRARARLPRGERDVMIGYLESAVGYSPSDALLWLQLAEARRGMFEANGGEAKYLLPALEAYRRSRDANPLLVEPHLWLGLYANRMSRADAPSDYLARASKLTPSDARIWYLAGTFAFRKGKYPEAWANWRRSVECSLTFLPEILKAVVTRPDVSEVLDDLLPTDLKILKAAASSPAMVRARAAKLRVIERALSAESNAADAQSRYRRAWLYREMDERDKAIVEYRHAVDLAPGQVEWRYELARELYDAGRFTEARKELSRVLDVNPTHANAKPLFRKAIQDEADPP